MSSRALAALMICPDRGLSQAFQAGTARSQSFQVTEDLTAYPTANQLDSKLRQLRPDVLLLDLGTQPDAAMTLIGVAAALTPSIYVIGLHSVSDATLIIQSMRAGSTEFLAAPFEHDSVHAAVTRIRKMQEAQTRDAPVRGKVIAFTAVKPGQGVTTIASNVAAELADDGKRRVLLIDFDMLGGTLSFCWRVTHSYSVLDAVQHAEKLDEALWGAIVTNRNGVDLLLGPESPEHITLQGDRYARLVEFARGIYEFVVLDLPCAYGPEAKATMPDADHTYLVCNPELPSLHLTRRCISHLEQDGFSRDQFSLLLNRLSRRGELGPQDMERVFNFPIGKVMPEDDGAVHRALTAGKPVPDSSALGREIAAFAKDIYGKGREEKKKAAGLSLSALLSQG